VRLEHLELLILEAVEEAVLLLHQVVLAAQA
jgi:hypothetical protein